MLLNQFDYVIGDCVEVLRGRSAGIKGYVTQIRKSVIVVKAKRISYKVRAKSVVLRKKSNMRRVRDLSVGVDNIVELINEVADENGLHQINLGEWRKIQMQVEKALFDTDK